MAGEKPEAKKLLTKLAQKEEMQMAEALLSTMNRDQQGAKANAIENAKKMLRDNVSPEQVSRWTSLQLEQVLALKNEMKIES